MFITTATTTTTTTTATTNTHIIIIIITIMIIIMMMIIITDCGEYNIYCYYDINTGLHGQGRGALLAGHPGGRGGGEVDRLRRVYQYLSLSLYIYIL